MSFSSDPGYLTTARLEGMNRLVAFMRMAPLLAENGQALAAGIGNAIQGDTQEGLQAGAFNRLVKERLGGQYGWDSRSFNPFHQGATVFQ